MFRRIGHLLAGLAAWSLALTPVADAQFRPQAAITRTLPSIAGLRPQDVFATSLYTGTGASQTITNGLDLLGKGGLAWFKNRSTSASHPLIDSVRGANVLYSDLTQAEASAASVFTGFTNSGFGITSGGTVINASGSNYVNWSFRRAPKFFDIVTYTGDGTSGRVIPHALGIKPGMIIVKRRDGVADWFVWHTSTSNARLFLNTTNAAISPDNGTIWGNNSTYVAPTAADFTVSSSTGVNGAGNTYVAYLFAHDPDTANGIVQCGSFTTDSGGNVSVNLGWRPQFLLAKRSTAASNWFLVDAARGAASLYANTSDAEATANEAAAYSFTATGFNYNWASSTQVYCAIRAPIQ